MLILSPGGYAALLTDHWQLVEQFENLVVVVMQLWQMNSSDRYAAAGRSADRSGKRN